MNFKKLILSVFAASTLGISNAQDLPVIVQAENGTTGSDFAILDTLGTTCIRPKTDYLNSTYPGSDSKVNSYTVNFSDSGTYDLYVRVLVGPGAYNDDSYFYGNGFGIKSPIASSGWIRANGLGGVGYASGLNVVDGNGAAGSGTWKWINMSKFTGDGTPITFRVNQGALTQTFMIGSRENGLYIDKFVFGRHGKYFTVTNLNRGEAGSDTYPVEKVGTPLAAGKNKFLGCAWDYVQAPYFASYWNQLTPGNAGKWGSVEGTRNVMNWSMLDTTFNFAKTYKYAFKEHTLIWGAQQPTWIGVLDSATQRQEIEQWFASVAARYDSIPYIDVVNEPIHNAPNGMIPWGTTTPNVNYAQALGGAGTTGYDWIITAFRLARKYFPKSKLILNEYSVINSSTTTSQIKTIVNYLKADTLIDGIGEQAHAFTTYGVSTATLKSNLDALASTGVPLYITEMDIDGLTDLAQYNEMKRVFKLFWEHPSIKGVTLWGYRYPVWRNDEGAFLVTSDEVDRPAFNWLKAYVNDTITLTQSINITVEGGHDTILNNVSKQLKANVLPLNTTVPNVTWSVYPSSNATIDNNGKITPSVAGKITVTATSWDGSGVTVTKDITVVNVLTTTFNAAKEHFGLYPNPSTDGNITLTGLEGITKIELINILGQTVNTFLTHGNNSISIKLNQKPGMYMFKFQQNNFSKIVKFELK